MTLPTCCVMDLGVLLFGVGPTVGGLEGGWLLLEPNVKGLDVKGVDGAAKGVKDNVFLGLGGSGGWRSWWW